MAEPEPTEGGLARGDEALADVRAECAALAAALDARPALDGELAAARAATEAILDSLSWRMAVPLRGAKRFVLEAQETARLARKYFARRRRAR